MIFYGFLWCVFYGLFSMVFYGFLWFPMVSYGFLWFSYGLFSMVFYGFLWFPMVSYGPTMEFHFELPGGSTPWVWMAMARRPVGDPPKRSKSPDVKLRALENIPLSILQWIPSESIPDAFHPRHFLIPAELTLGRSAAGSARPFSEPTAPGRESPRRRRGKTINHFIAFQPFPIMKSFHFISFHFISFHFISFHFISFHFISFHCSSTRFPIVSHRFRQ